MPDFEEPPIDLAWYVAAQNSPEMSKLAAVSRAEATQLVTDFIGGEANPFSVPQAVLDRAILEVGADLYYRQAARNGVVGIGGDDMGQIFRLNRDPMAAAYPLLRRYLAQGL